MSSIATTRSPWTKALAVVCVAVIMLATTIEVAHGHLVATRSSNSMASKADAVTAVVDCAICFAAHSPAAIFVVAQVVAKTIAPTLVRTIEPVSVTRTFHFSLFVRPPPLG